MPALGGTVEGLANGASLKLSYGSEWLTVTANGSFVFKAPTSTGSSYSVGLVEAPTGQGCAITDGAGVVGANPEKAVRVRCAAQSGTDVFVHAPQGLADLEPLYASFCPKEVQDNRSMQHVVPVDLNLDRRLDLIVFIWCSPVVGGTDYSGTTPSRILAFIQDAQGNFLDKTAEVFGSATVQPGGVGEYYLAGDFNRDGYVDIAWSLNREDGRRINNPPTTQYVKNVALISQGAGRYAMVEFGNAAWGFGLTPLDNAQGGLDFVATSVSEGQKGWTYGPGVGFTPIPGFDWVGSSGALFFERPGPGLGSQAAINTAREPDRLGLDLYLPSAGQWVKSPGGFYYPSSTIQKLCCNNTQPSGAVFVRLDGRDLIDPSFAFTCQFRRTPTSRPEALTVFGANEIVGGYTGQVVVYNQTPLLELFKLMAFGISADNRLQRNPLIIRNEVERDVMANRMSCGDLNGDGFDDIILHVTKSNQSPLIYLNDGTGAFDRINPLAMPKSPLGARASNYLLADLDQDGVLDLIYFPIIAYAGQENRILVHKGVRKFRASDVLK